MASEGLNPSEALFKKEAFITLYRWLNHFVEKLAMFFIVVITSVTMYRVILRFFFNSTPSWTEEFTCILVIWITLLGMAIGIRENLHLSITLFFDQLPSRGQKILEKLIYVGQLLFGLFFVIEGTSLSLSQSRATMSVVRLHPFTDTLMPNSILYLGLPVSGVLMIMYTLIHLFDKNGVFDIKSMDTKDID